MQHSEPSKFVQSNSSCTGTTRSADTRVIAFVRVLLQHEVCNITLCLNAESYRELLLAVLYGFLVDIL